MDYGHKGQSDYTQPFFTAGVGVESPFQNTTEPENNLDLTNQHSWSEDQSFQSIGNKAITLPNDIPDNSEQLSNQEVLSPSVPINETVNASLPPGMIMNNAPEASDFSPVESYDSKIIRTKGEHLTKDTVAEIDHQITKLKQTGNVSDFYTSIRGNQNTPGMMRQNLKNSYNREVG